MQLLSAGSTLVYSTCTLNPVEGEAVVGAALEQFGLDFVRLLPLPDWMTSLVRPCGGLSEWLVPSAEFEKQPGSQRGMYGAVATNFKTFH